MVQWYMRCEWASLWAMDLSARERLAEGRDAEIFAWDDELVLRLMRDPTARPKLERELAAMRALWAQAAMVPEAKGIVEVDGRPGLLMERLEGRDLVMYGVRYPWKIMEVVRLTVTIQAQIHEMAAPAELPGLREKIRDSVNRNRSLPPGLAAKALRILEGLPEGDRLCHGDFHPGNVFVTRRGPVVIDWPEASRGHPTGDLARSTAMLRLGSLAPGTPSMVRAARFLGGGLFREAYLREYRKLRASDANLLRRWETVRAAERLADNVPEERAALLREIETAEFD